MKHFYVWNLAVLLLYKCNVYILVYPNVHGKCISAQWERNFTL